jgi:hypothetical protein
LSKVKEALYKCDICNVEERVNNSYGLPKKWYSIQIDIDHKTTKEKYLCGSCCKEIGLKEYDSYSTMKNWEIWDKIYLIIKRITKRGK